MTDWINWQAFQPANAGAAEAERKRRMEQQGAQLHGANAQLNQSILSNSARAARGERPDISTDTGFTGVLQQRTDYQRKAQNEALTAPGWDFSARRENSDPLASDWAAFSKRLGGAQAEVDANGRRMQQAPRSVSSAPVVAPKAKQETYGDRYARYSDDILRGVPYAQAIRHFRPEDG